jgi:hypothetical protein
LHSGILCQIQHLGDSNSIHSCLCRAAIFQSLSHAQGAYRKERQKRQHANSHYKDGDQHFQQADAFTMSHGNSPDAKPLHP